LMADSFVGILTGLLTGISASYFTIQFTLKKFFAERWWDRKEKAYSEIIDSLFDLLHYCEIEEQVEDGQHYSKERLEFLGERFSDALWKIKRATAICALNVSDDAQRILMELSKRPDLKWSEEPPWELWEREAKYYRDALMQMIEAAKNDLRASSLKFLV